MLEVKIPQGQQTMVIDSSQLAMHSLDGYRPVCLFTDEDVVPGMTRGWNSQTGMNEVDPPTKFTRVKILVARDEVTALGVLNAQLAVKASDVARMSKDLQDRLATIAKMEKENAELKHSVERERAECGSALKREREAAASKRKLEEDFGKVRQAIGDLRLKEILEGDKK